MTKNINQVKYDTFRADLLIQIEYASRGRYCLPFYDEYAKIFPESNEPLKEIYKGKDLRGKKVLTVGASGDHPLVSILCGATDIDVFDINRLSEYFIGLKCAAVKGLDFEGFCRVFNFSKNIKPTDLIGLYEKVQFHLPLDVRMFWDYFYDPQNIGRLKYLFFKSYKEVVPSVNGRAAYVDKRNFGELKERIYNANINFIHSDIRDLPEVLDETYDHINLSNIIFCYLPEDTSCMDTANELKGFINPGGDMYCSYLFQRQLNSKRISYLKALQAESQNVEGSRQFFGIKKKGKILVYNK